MAVAVVNYNTRLALDLCLRSLDVRDDTTEVLVVDNGSSDGSVELVRSRHPAVKVHVEPSNPGYGAAANVAMALTSAPYLLLLNSDTILGPGTVRGLHDHLESHPRAAVVGPRILNPDGSLQPSCFPFPHPLLTVLGGTGLEALIRRVPGLRSRHLPTWSHDRVRSVPWVLGAALGIRRSAFDRIGGFREDFFMYMEETDLCYRARLAGWETHFTPAAQIVHTGGVSTDRMRTQMRLRYYRSLMRYHDLHGSRARARISYGVLRMGAAVKLLRDQLRLRGSLSASDRQRLEQDMEAWRIIMAAGWLDGEQKS